MSSRTYNPLDRLVMNLDSALRTVLGEPVGTGREDPAAAASDGELSDVDRRHAEGLMRVNHAGEVSAQALYQGQALTARLDRVRSAMEQAATEENDHLLWCEKRIGQLQGHTSYLGPLWYAGSFAIGAVAGLAGDRWSLGFVAETERQVVRHLEDHLQQLPASDHKSRAILEQMKIDEARHATTAVESGGEPLPAPVRGLMGVMSRVMTKTAYWL